MARTSHPTGYARLTPWQARAVLAALVLVSLFCVGITLSPLAVGFADKPRRFAEGDVQLYRAKIDRVVLGKPELSPVRLHARTSCQTPGGFARAG